MTRLQRVAQIFGVVFLVAGVLGFLYGRGSMEADPVLAPKILGLFAINVLHNIVHLLFGAWGLVAAKSYGGARQFCRSGGLIYLILALLGLVQPNGFGLVPLGGHDIWLHGFIAVGLMGFGFTSKPQPQPAPAA